MVSQLHPLHVVLATLFLAIVSIVSAPAGTVPPDHTPDTDTVQQQLESLQPVFRRNMGQWPNEVLYRTAIHGNSVRFMPGGVSFAYMHHDEEKEGEDLLATDAREQSHEDEHESALIWNVMFDGMNRDARIVGENEKPGPFSYFIGDDPADHHANVPECSRLWYRDIYPEIDLRYSTVDGALKYDYIIRPGGTPSNIAMRCDGIERLRINERGELEITTAWGVVVEAMPVAWQDIDGRRQSVDVRYKLLSDTAYGFAVHGAYRPDHELVIDPVIFGWSTFIGGNDASADGYLLDIALDSNGNVYGSGHYTNDFPTTPGVFQRNHNGDNADVFVFKLNRYGSQLLYATYIGGSRNDSATGIVVTPRGEAIICGTTHSSNYPTTAGSLFRTRNGGTDLVLSKLNASGNALIFSTFVGGSGLESRAHLAVDSSGDIYLAGATSSSNFPTTASAYDRTLAGNSDAAIVRVSPNADTLRYGTYLGGSGIDTAATIAVDRQGNAVVAGTTTSQDFPLTPGAVDRTGIATGQGGWLAKITPDGRNLLASTKLRAYPRRVVVDGNGMIVVAGDLFDGLRNGGFAATPGVFDGTYGGNGDAVVMRLTGDLGALDFASYLGGSGQETVTGLTIAPDGDIIVSGSIFISRNTLKQPGFKPDFPLTTCSFDRTHGYSNANGNAGEFEGFFTRISPDATRLHYSTLIGGSYDDYKINVAVHDTRAHEVVISTTTHAPDFPTTQGVYQRTKNNATQDQPVVVVLKPVITPTFRADTLGCGTVTFIDSTFGECIWRDGAWKPTSWLWDFGDGATSTEQFPTHEYTKLGTYRVKLIVGDPIDSTTRTVVVKSVRTDVELNAHIDRTHAANLGDKVVIPLVLDDDPDSLQATSITITLHHDTTMLGTLPVDDIDVDWMIDETQLEGWDASISSPRAGTIVFRATAPEGEVLRGPGTLLWVDFRTFLRADVLTASDSVWTSELPFELAVNGNYCTNVILKPGQLTLRACGLQYRLIERSDFAIKLNAAQPNPFNPTTVITFSLAFDGPARLEMFNEAGERVSMPVDGEMKAGEYTLTWNAAAFPSGVYYYRLTSGTWSQTRSMVLVK